MGRGLSASSRPIIASLESIRLMPRLINKIGILDATPYELLCAMLSESPRVRTPVEPARILNNVVQQDHRGIKRRVNANQGFRSFDGAWLAMKNAGHNPVTCGRFCFTT